MSYCLNPNCQKPQNQAGTKFCQACGTSLLLRKRYRIIRLLGSPGGFGRTFLAEDADRLKAHCAIKQFCPMPQIQNNPQAFQNATVLFNQEARQLLQLGQHPQIPTMFAYFEEDTRLYLVQESIEGQNLGEELEKSGALSEQQIRELLQDLLPVIQFIHQHQVIHRDIKPTNILRRQQTGQLVLIDFGISKQLAQTALSVTGTAYIGTPGYAPIEQMQWGKAYPASDLYSLGVTCLHLLTQVVPEELYDPLNQRWLWRDYLGQRGMQISNNLGRVLDKLVMASLHGRYQSATEVLNDLNATSPLKSDLVVAQVGTADYRTIGEAIENAQPGSRILVRPGFYQESLAIDKPLEILGDGAIEDITIGSEESACIQMQTYYAVVGGLTLRHGTGNSSDNSSAVDIPKGELILENCYITSTGTACIYIHGAAANPRIRKCRIDVLNFGIKLDDGGQGTVEDCDIFGNGTRGVYITSSSKRNSTIRGCKIHNQSTGVVIEGNGTVEDCNIFGNLNSGILIYTQANSTIRRCQIHDQLNGVLISGNGTVEDCNIFDNRSDGIYIGSSGSYTITFQRCKINQNGGHGLCYYFSQHIKQCDLTGNIMGETFERYNK